MTTDFYKDWTDLEGQAASSNKNIKIRIKNSDYWIVWDVALNVPYFVIEVNTKWSKKELKKITTKGMEATLIGTDLTLSLKDPNSISLFIKMCIEMIEKSLKGTTTDDATRSVIKSYISFFKLDTRKLGEEIQMGLYGELKLLEKLLNHFPKKKLKVVEGWKGPTASYHDFQYPSMCIEVKTTATKSPVQATIGNEKQLDRMKLKGLWLNAYSYVKVPGEDSLPKIIKRIEKQLKGTAALIPFSRLLGMFCIREDFDSYDTGYSEQKEYWFDVKKGFPAITKILPGIGNISYGLLLNEVKNSFKVNEVDVFGVLKP